MDLKEYQEKSRTTALYPNLGENIVYPTLGLVGEIGETFEKIKELPSKEDLLFTDGRPNYDLIFNYEPIQNYQEKIVEIQKEFGDVLWYLSQCCSELGIDLYDTFHTSCHFKYSKGTIDDMVVRASRIAEIVKKVIRDKDGVSDNDTVKAILEELSNISDCLKNVLEAYDVDIHVVAQQNIDKLFSRKERGTLQGSGDNR